MTVLQWTESNGVRVEVVEPVLAASGKCRAIRLLSSARRSPAIPDNKAVAMAGGADH
jgi:hypothetical protein